MKELYAQTRVTRRNLETGAYTKGGDGKKGLRYEVMLDLARSLAVELLKTMSVLEEVDPATGDLLVRATVSVVERDDVPRMTATEVLARGQQQNFNARYIPATLTKEKLLEAMELMKGNLIDTLPEMIPIPMPPPVEWLSDRMLRKKAILEGEAVAVAKARGEKEVRENTKKRGPVIQIEVGVRKITMPEPKKESTG